MLFTRFALAALPFVGTAVAGPLSKRAAWAMDVLTQLQENVASPVTIINTYPTDGTDLPKCLEAITSRLATASDSMTTAVQENTDDVADAGTVLTKIIEEVVNAADGIDVDLDTYTTITPDIADVDAGFSTLVTETEAVLSGVIAELTTSLADYSSALESFGNGSLAATLGL